MPAINFLRSFVVYLGLISLNVASWSQTPAAAPPLATPATPDEFMRQAADAMSLTAPDMKPWHLRAKYKQFNVDGSVNREGVFEEWWASADHFKTTYTGANFSRTDYRSGQSAFYTGDDNMPKPIDFTSSNLLVHPLPYPARFAILAFTSKGIGVGQNTLQCYVEEPKNAKTDLSPAYSYCFDQALPVARLSLERSGTRTTWNGIVRIHGHYLAKRIQVAAPKQDHPFITVDVEQIDPQLGIEEAAIEPPADAKRREVRNCDVIAAVTAPRKISGDNPFYPATASSVRAEGTVVVQATITKEGAVIDAKVVSGPLVLKEGALRAVKTWRFEPTLLCGEPVEVETIVNVVFHL